MLCVNCCLMAYCSIRCRKYDSLQLWKWEKGILVGGWMLELMLETTSIGCLNNVNDGERASHSIWVVREMIKLLSKLNRCDDCVSGYVCIVWLVVVCVRTAWIKMSTDKSLWVSLIFKVCTIITTDSMNVSGERCSFSTWRWHYGDSYVLQ